MRNPSILKAREKRPGLILEQFAEGKSHVGAQSDCHPTGLLRQRVPNPTVVGLSGGKFWTGKHWSLTSTQNWNHVEIPLVWFQTIQHCNMVAIFSAEGFSCFASLKLQHFKPFNLDPRKDTCQMIWRWNFRLMTPPGCAEMAARWSYFDPMESMVMPMTNHVRGILSGKPG